MLKYLSLKSIKKERAVVLSEFGGYSHGVEEHCGSPIQFGYARYKTIGEFNDAFKRLYEEEIIPQNSILREFVGGGIYE